MVGRNFAEPCCAGDARWWSSRGGCVGKPARGKRVALNAWPAAGGQLGVSENEAAARPRRLLNGQYLRRGGVDFGKI